MTVKLHFAFLLFYSLDCAPVRPVSGYSVRQVTFWGQTACAERSAMMVYEQKKGSNTKFRALLLSVTVAAYRSRRGSSVLQGSRNTHAKILSLLESVVCLLAVCVFCIQNPWLNLMK